MFAAKIRDKRIAPNPGSRRRLRGFRIPLIALSLMLLQGFTGPVQGADTATISGTVLDGEGKPLKGLRVTIRGDEFEQTASTNKKGRFKATVPDAAARYEISFEREGFPTYSEPLTFARGGIVTTQWKMDVTPLGSPTGSMTALLAFNAGAKAYNADDHDLALEKFGEAVAADPELMEALSAIASIHHARGDHEQASLAADRVLALDAKNVAALRIRYLADLELGRDGAGEILDRLAELDRSPETAVLLYNEGVAAVVAGDRAQALARYELASGFEQAPPAVHGALAALYLSMKNYEAALASSARLLEFDAESARGLSVRYNTFIAMGRNEEAQAMLEALQRAAPDAVATAYFDRGAALFDDGEIDRAIPALEQALQADPSLAPGHYTLALCYMNRDRNEDAGRHLAKFLELAPDDPNAGAARQLLEILTRSD